MKMRTSLFCALQGLGVVAHESLAYFKADHSKGGHRYLDGCGKAGKGNWVPDPATFVLPQNNFKPSDHWGLCADGHDCAPHEATGKVYFDFQDDGLVFNFEGIDHYKYEDVSIYVERARPPHAHSTKYNKNSDHCKAKNNYKEVKCHIPYFSLTDGGSYDKMCPLKGEGGWRFYIKIKATIVHGDKRFELYNRESTNGEKYFSLSYTCAKCRHHKHDPKIELINAASRRDEGSEHKHHGGIMATTTATITRSTMITMSTITTRSTTIIRSTTATSMDIITRSTMTTRSITTISTATITRSTTSTRSTMDTSTIMKSITTTRSIMITSMVTATITVTSIRRSTMPNIIMSTTISTTMIMATAILMATSTVTVITTVIITVITMAMSTIIRSTTATITATTMVIIMDITTVMSITISIITATTMAMATSMDTTTVTSMDIITVIIMITSMVITTRVTTTATTTTEAFTSVMPAFLTTMV
ncbi:Hypothetical protein NCS54_00023100 [Fusarium falciforme]|uniref:Hypothetical protein n=1 Tax=Fusarium falciforme TaxID=195108 RepID=UPI0023019731|nr:Hypothetical protein NCS54_00023100 [Fusarium falciforme]WAO83051.1 Hypothetical protein NCS54_00023100 [Fusarium falciforme]